MAGDTAKHVMQGNRVVVLILDRGESRQDDLTQWIAVPQNDPVRS